jgi:glutaredoxin
MEYEPPSEKNYTIYSKSGCPSCSKAKTLLKDEEVLLIDCDEFLIEDKEDFLEYMKTIIGKEYRMFPMIFKDGKFIGGFSELKPMYEREQVLKNLEF